LADPDLLRVERGGAYGARIAVRRAVEVGTLLARFAGFRRVAQPTTYSIQVAPDEHIDGLGRLRNLNHSCAPSAIVNTDALTLTAARDLAPGDEVTFFYPSTEWEMRTPFTCLCGRDACLGTISGARDLPADVLARYWLNRHIRELLAARRHPTRPQ
jgi:hypothetical protein